MLAKVKSWTALRSGQTQASSVCNKAGRRLRGLTSHPRSFGRGEGGSRAGGRPSGNDVQDAGDRGLELWSRADATSSLRWVTLTVLPMASLPEARCFAQAPPCCSSGIIYLRKLLPHPGGRCYSSPSLPKAEALLCFLFKNRILHEKSSGPTFFHTEGHLEHLEVPGGCLDITSQQGSPGHPLSGPTQHLGNWVGGQFCKDCCNLRFSLRL